MCPTSTEWGKTLGPATVSPAFRCWLLYLCWSRGLVCLRTKITVKYFSEVLKCVAWVFSHWGKGPPACSSQKVGSNSHPLWKRAVQQASISVNARDSIWAFEVAARWTVVRKNLVALAAARRVPQHVSSGPLVRAGPADRGSQALSPRGACGVGRTQAEGCFGGVSAGWRAGGQVLTRPWSEGRPHGRVWTRGGAGGTVWPWRSALEVICGSEKTWSLRKLPQHGAHGERTLKNAEVAGTAYGDCHRPTHGPPRGHTLKS